MSFLLDLFGHLVVFIIVVVCSVIMVAVIELPFIIYGILQNYGITACWQVWTFASLAWWVALFTVMWSIINPEKDKV